MFPLFRAIVKFCSTNRLSIYDLLEVFATYMICRLHMEQFLIPIITSCPKLRAFATDVTWLHCMYLHHTGKSQYYAVI